MAASDEAGILNSTTRTWLPSKGSYSNEEGIFMWKLLLKWVKMKGNLDKPAFEFDGAPVLLSMTSSASTKNDFIKYRNSYFRDTFSLGL